jgi:hypothetical protein
MTESKNFVNQLKLVDESAEKALIDLFIKHDIKELDVSTDDYDCLRVFVFDDNEHIANGLVIDSIEIENGSIMLTDNKGSFHSSTSLHDGSMPYVYAYVENLLKDKINNEENTYEVWLYYHGCFNTFVKASNTDEARRKARNEVDELSELDFLHEIKLCDNGCDVSLVKVCKVLD